MINVHAFFDELEKIAAWPSQAVMQRLTTQIGKSAGKLGKAPRSTPMTAIIRDGKMIKVPLRSQTPPGVPTLG